MLQAKVRSRPRIGTGTSNNTNAVATMDTPFANDPASLADMELMHSKMNEFILAARR